MTTTLPLPGAVRQSTPPKVVPVRLMSSMWRQSGRTAKCPLTPRLDGRLALVTGGNRGIGYQTARGLAQRGAEVIMAARNRATARDACEQIQLETGAAAQYLPLDLSDQASVRDATAELERRTNGRAVDIVVANAGVWPMRYAESRQGHEIAFATNVLGHFLLIRRLLDGGKLVDGRVVVVTGDIYRLTSDCTPDYRYRGAIGGQLAYCRSKLGNLWLAAELQHRYPQIRVNSVHPGVVASQLGGVDNAVVRWVKRWLLTDLETGAQTSLYCATQPGLRWGGYYHNTLGDVQLHPSDPASDRSKAAALWTRLEQLSESYR